MEKTPLSGKNLEQFRMTRPAVRWIEKESPHGELCIGIAESFELVGDTLTVALDFVNMSGRMMYQHTMHFTACGVLEEGDILKLEHAGGILEITNLARETYRARQGKAQMEKKAHHP